MLDLMIIVITSASTIPTTRAATTIIFVFSSYRFFLFLLCADFLPEPVDDLLFAGLLDLLPEDTDFTDFSSGRPVLVRLLSCAVALFGRLADDKWLPDAGRFPDTGRLPDADRLPDATPLPGCVFFTLLVVARLTVPL